MTNYAIKFQKDADGYLKLAADALDPRDQMLCLNLARECLRFITDAREMRR
jgi:hypothetical protein